MLCKGQKEKTQPLSKMTNNWSKRCVSPLGESRWKCTSPIRQQLRRKTLRLNAVLHWLETRKKVDLKTLLGKCIMSKDGHMVRRTCQNFTSLQGILYLYSTPKGEDENLLLFIVPRAHQIAALNGCHRDMGHQGHDRTLSLLQEHFWWPGLVNQMRQVIKTCRPCLQYEGSTPKAPLCPIVATAPLDLIHVDFTSIETMMELDKSP